MWPNCYFWGPDVVVRRSISPQPWSIRQPAAIISFGVVPTIVTVIVIALTILCWPSARRLTVNRAWCVITAHRVRVGCVEGLIYSSRGKIPVVLWTSQQARGERVLLYCRAGTSADDFVSARSILATACWAQDIVIFVDIRHTQLVTLYVMRRPTSDLTSDFESHRSPEPSGGPPVWPGNQDM